MKTVLMHNILYIFIEVSSFPFLTEDCEYTLIGVIWLNGQVM